MREKCVGIFLLISSFAVFLAFLALPEPAHAQCGSSASSCKSCHEAQKADPVNTKGAWHTAHAFGDFCAFCHSGNTKAKEKAAAHVGMVGPLEDVKGACQSCHPNDFMERAKKYAAVLGTLIGSGGSPTKPAATQANMNFGPIPPMGGTIIDLNKVYAGLDQPQPNVAGNTILILLIAGVAFMLAGMVLYYEKPIPQIVGAFRELLAAPVTQGEPGTIPPELASLMPLLSSSDPGTLRAVARVLSDREYGPRVLNALSNLDLRSLAALGETDQKALASLLTLAKEMKS